MPALAWTYVSIDIHFLPLFYSGLHSQVDAKKFRNHVHRWISSTILESNRRFYHNCLGQPLVGSGLSVLSVSYAGGWAVVAHSVGGPVGIDAEPRSRKVHDPAGCAAVICNPSEIAALSYLNDESLSAQVINVWTAKEAILKMWGIGLRCPPAVFGINTVENRMNCGSTDFTPRWRGIHTADPQLDPALIDSTVVIHLDSPESSDSKSTESYSRELVVAVSCPQPVNLTIKQHAPLEISSSGSASALT